MQGIFTYKLGHFWVKCKDSYCSTVDHGSHLGMVSRSVSIKLPMQFLSLAARTARCLETQGNATDPDSVYVDGPCIISPKKIEWQRAFSGD